MSLINEALKKAQSERPGSASGANSHMMHAPGSHPHPPARKRNYLWGFLLSVVIVGLFSASISTFLVFKILDEEEGSASAAPSAQAADPAPAPEPASMAEGTAPQVAAETVESTESAPELPAGPASSGDSLVQQISPSTSESAVATSESAPSVQAGGAMTVPNAPSWARIDQLEIRGMMSGGTKVLIYDSGTGKTRSFVAGDLVDGQLGLKISSIESNTIVFEDYGGNKLTKPF